MARPRSRIAARHTIRRPLGAQPSTDHGADDVAGVAGAAGATDDSPTVEDSAERDASGMPSRDTAESPSLRYQTMGAAIVMVGDLRMDPSFGTLFWLLVRLAYSPGLTVLREELLRECWPGMTNVRQRGNLRQSLYKLRSFGVDVALAGKTVRLAAAQVDRTFSVERSREAFERDVTRGHEPFGSFLPGFQAPWPEFQEWLDRERESVHAEVRRILVEQLRSRRARADWMGVEAMSRWLLPLDPLNEDATLALAECAMMAGSKAEAIAILDRYLADLGPGAGEIRLPATQLRRRFTEPPTRSRVSLAPTERHFVGREEEMADLTLSMRRARWHDGSAVLLHGPAGIGKTRLTAELEKVAMIEGFRTIRVECRESDRARPLRAFIETLEDLSEVPGALGCAPESLSLLSRLLGKEITARSKPHEIVTERHDRAAVNGVDSSAQDFDDFDERMRDSRSRSLRHAVIDLFAAVSEERPILLIVDDVQWIDDDSWELLSDLTERVIAMRLQAVLTSRLESIRAKLPERIPNNLLFRHLPQLTNERLSHLANAISHDLSAVVDDNLMTWFVNSCEGNPLLLHSLVNHWIETGDAGGVPARLHALIDRRIDRVSLGARKSLQTITLLGRFASILRVKNALQLPTHSFLDFLGELEQANCLSRSSNGVIGVHELIARSALSRMSWLVETTLRIEISNALLSEYEETFSIEVLEQAIEQLSLAGSYEELFRVMTKHSDPIIDSGRALVVLRTLNDAVQHLGGVPNNPLLTELFARLELESGQYGRSYSICPDRFSLPRKLDCLSSKEVESLLSWVDSAYRADPIIERDALVRFALDVAETRQIPWTTRLRAAEITLVISSNTCDELSAKRAELVIDDLETGSSDSTALNHPRLIFHTIFGDRGKAATLASSVLRLAETGTASTVTYRNAVRSGFALRSAGDFASAKSALKLSLRIASVLKSPGLELYPLWQLSSIALDEGDLHESEGWASKLADHSLSAEDAIASNFIPSHFCRLAIRRGDYQAASVLLESYRRTLPRLPVVRASAFSVALELGVNLMRTDWSPSDALLTVARLRHDETSCYGSSDFLTSSIVDGLARNQQKDVASVLVSNYVALQRRDLSPLSAELKRSIARLGNDLHSDTDS